MEKRFFNTFQLKIIALISMLTDHFGILLGSNSSLYLPCRFLGRISFPIFAFLIATGIKHTKNRAEYFKRIFIFAVISQIPYFLLNGNFSNLFVINKTDVIIAFIQFIFLSFLLKDTGLNKKYCLIAFLYVFTPLFTKKQNVLYTFVFSMLIVELYEGFNKRDIKSSLILTVLSFVIPFSTNVLTGEYGLLGALLVLFLYASKRDIFKPVFILLWAFIYYVLNKNTNSFYFIPVIFSALIALFYNQKEGKKIRYFFYAFYPAHIFIFGVLKQLFLLK